MAPPYVTPPRALASASAPRRWSFRVIAGGLAALYGLLAAGGDGWHLLAHQSADGSVHGQAASDEHVCDGGCLFSASNSTPPNARPSKGQARSEAYGLGQRSDQSEGPAPHEHDCSVCQFLGQLKLATASPNGSLQVSKIVALVDVSSDASPFVHATYAFLARGPPTA